MLNPIYGESLHLLLSPRRPARPHTLLLALLLAAVGIIAASAGTASANGGPHGGYTPTSDGCAGCHRTHAASSAKLLVNTNTALCLTCHGTAATGADTNVADGIYEGTTLGVLNAGLNGGGFTYVKQDTSLAGVTTGAVTSIHTVYGTPGYSAAATMWGAGAVVGASPGTTGTGFDLYCTSCHDPHGSPNYRMLRATVNGVAVSLPETEGGAGQPAKSYTQSTYYGGTGVWNVSDFCGACHTRYDAATAASGETSSTDFVYTYRHRIDVQSGATLNGAAYWFGASATSPAPAVLNLPVSSSNGAAPAFTTTSPYTDTRVEVCLTCHYAHGTKATMGPNSGAVPWPGGASTPNGNARSSLLRLDNRGVCENCHKK